MTVMTERSCTGLLPLGHCFSNFPSSLPQTMAKVTVCYPKPWPKFINYKIYKFIGWMEDLRLLKKIVLSFMNPHYFLMVQNIFMLLQKPKANSKKKKKKVLTKKRRFFIYCWPESRNKIIFAPQIFLEKWSSRWNFFLIILEQCEEIKSIKECRSQNVEKKNNIYLFCL